MFFGKKKKTMPEINFAPIKQKFNMHVAIVCNGTHMNNAELFGYHVKCSIF